MRFVLYSNEEKKLQMAPLLALVALACGLLSTASSQNINNAAPQLGASQADCSAELDLNPQDNTTSNATLNVCHLQAKTQLLNLTAICFSQCESCDILYLLIDLSGPQAVISSNLSLYEECSGAVNVPTPTPDSPSASYVLVWNNSSVPEGCTATAEELLLSSVFFSMDVSQGYSSTDVCLTFFDPNINDTSQPSCVHLLPPPTISYTPKPLPALYKSGPVAVVNGGLNVNDLSNIIYAEVTIDQSTFTQGDRLIVTSANLQPTSFPNGTLTITGEASPLEYTAILGNVLFTSRVELVFFTIEFREDMAMRQVYLGNNHEELTAFASSISGTVSLNVTLQARNSVLDNDEYIYIGLFSIEPVDTPTSSSLLILNCNPDCTRALTSIAYINHASEPSYYNEAGDLIVRDILVRLLDVRGSVLATAMLEVDIVPVNNHAPVLLIWLPCNSTSVATYRQRRHTPSRESHGGQRGLGHTWYSSKHAPNFLSAYLESTPGHTPCLWSITVTFGADTNAPPMEGLGTLLHLLPSRLNDAVVGVAWVDERTLFFKVTGCWLLNDTGSIDLVFKPQGESCSDHAPCTRGVCFANRTGCPVRGVYRVQLGTAHQVTLPHPPSGMLILCLQFLTVGVVIASLLVMWQMVKRRRRFVGYKIGEDEVPCVSKTPPQVAINITPPPSKQPPKKKLSACNQSTMRPELLSHVGSPHGKQSTSNGAPMSAGPPVVGNPPSEVMTEAMWSPEQLEGGEEPKVASREKEVEPHPLGVSTDVCARSEGVAEERLVPTVGALQSEGGMVIEGVVMGCGQLGEAIN
eukprot:Em0002g1607a